MTTLKFDDTHNMVAFLAKPAESEWFEQIVDFLNAHTIKYVLTVNPTIYISYIEQFWTTAKVKTINGEVQLQALVYGKKIIITKSIMRTDLQLKDAEGVDCLPNATIFEQLTLMGAKTTAWNEFSSTMAYAIICLATNQKFNFSKYIFESMVKNLENVSAQQEHGEGSTMHTDPYHIPTIIQPLTSQPQKKQRSRRSKRKDTEVPQPSGPTTNVADKAVNEEMDDSLVRVATTVTRLDAEQDIGNINKTRSKINVAEKEVSTADPVTIAGEVVTTASVEISIAKPTKTMITDDLTLARTLIEIRNKGKAIMEEPEKPTNRKDQIRHDEEVAQRLQAQMQAELEEEDRLDNQLKNKSFDDVQKLFDKAIKRVNTFVDMDTELVEGSEVRAEGSETRAEGKVMPNEEEVALDAIPLASPSIVDWKILKEGKKSYYQIIKVDESSKMYLVFSHMLKSFDREDLETLHKLVKAKYGSTRPMEDLDLVLYGYFKTMFEPHVEDNVWKNQSDYKVLDWKLYDSSGVHSLRKQNWDQQDYDEFSTAKAVLMANMSSYELDVLSEVPYSENTHNDMLNQSVQEMLFSEQTHLVNYPKNKITSVSNIIPYSQYLPKTQNAAVQDTNSSAQQDAMILSVFEQLYKERVKLLEERQNMDLSTREKLIIDDIIQDKNALFADFEKEINSLKQTLSEQLKEKESLTTTFNVLRNESKEKEVKNIDKEIAFEKKVKELDNIVYEMGQSAQTKAQQIRPMLYDCSVIANETNVISNADSKETLMLEEGSRSKIILKQSDPMVLKKKVLFYNKNCLMNKLSGYKLHTLILANLLHHFSKLRLLGNFQRIVEQTKAKRPLDNVLDLTCKHAKRIQELLVYVRDTCPNVIKLSEKKVAITPMNNINKVRFSEPLTSSSNIKQVESAKTSDSDTPILSSTGLKCSTSTCRSQPTCNKKNDKISQKPSSNRKNKVEAQPRKVNKKNHVKEPICDENVKHTMLNANSWLIFVKCKQCMFDANHDVCFHEFVNDVNMHAKYKSKSKKNQVHNIWKPTGKVFTDVGYKWKPTGRLFTIVGNSCPLTRFTPKKIVHLKETTSISVETSKAEIKVYSRRPKLVKSVGSSKKAKIVQSKFANNSEPTHLWGSNATNVPSSSSLVNDRLSRLFSVRFRNNQIAKIMGYGDYQLGNIIISRVYYVEGLGHNLFYVGQFCDADLVVALQKNTCFIWNLEGVDLLSGSKNTNLYIISLDDMLKTSTICLLSKASNTKSWLWHRRLSHLNFGTLNKLAKDGLARGIPKLKFQKDHLYLACALGKSKKSSHQPKVKDTNQEKLYILHMDLCGPMCVESINKKKYILVIVDDYSRFTWVRFLRSKDEAPDAIIKSMASEQFGSGLGLQLMTPATSSSGLVTNPIPQQPFPVAVAPRAVDIADSYVSTSIDQDAPSTNLTSQGSSSNVRPTHTPFEHIGRWTKDHPIANVIGDPSCSVSTRKQLKTDIMWSYFDAFLTSVKPKNFKQAMTEPS
ncbi:retrovirus-related pol polyprotein from transposon TNT 1-94 [Tanacetum coccineum]